MGRLLSMKLFEKTSLITNKVRFFAGGSVNEDLKPVLCEVKIRRVCV